MTLFFFTLNQEEKENHVNLIKRISLELFEEIEFSTSNLKVIDSTKIKSLINEFVILYFL